MNPIFSTVLLLAIVIVAWSVVLSIGTPTIESTVTSTDIIETEQTLSYIDNYVREVVKEGSGATRIFKFSVGNNEYETIPGEEVVQFTKTAPSALFEYFSRIFIKNIMRIAGADVDCYGADVDGDGSIDLVMENTFLKVGFQKVNKTTPLSSINTTTNIIYMKEKTYNNIVIPVNTSIVIDDDTSTSYGTGYSELLREKKNVPRCVIHFFVNSTVDYDVYYTLYAGADFLVIDIRNIT